MAIEFTLSSLYCLPPHLIERQQFTINLSSIIDAFWLTIERTIMGNLIKLVFSIILILSVSSCGIYYRDEETGAEHIWGIGHLATKVTAPENGKQAVIRKAMLAGIALGVEEGIVSTSVGWNQRDTIAIYDENTAIVIQRPEDDNFFLFKFGTQPSGLISSDRNNNK